MNIEVKKDDTAHIFTYTQISDGLADDITTATIVLLSPTKQIQVASTAMTINDNVATYSNDFSATPTAGTYGIDRNYQVIMTIDGVEQFRLYDIVKYPFINNVTQNDLDAENKAGLVGKGLRTKGEADSGTTTTLVDTQLVGINSLLGGQLEIYTTSASQTTHMATITIHNTATGSLTFTPAIDDAVTTNRYNATSSFDNDIVLAGDKVQEALWKKDLRSTLILDNTQVNRMIVYKFFEMLFAKNRRSISETDVDHVNYLYYRDLYDSELNGLPLHYDSDENDAISDSEEKWKDSIRALR